MDIKRTFAADATAGGNYWRVKQEALEASKKARQKPGFFMAASVSIQGLADLHELRAQLFWQAITEGVKIFVDRVQFLTPLGLVDREE